MSMNDYCDSCRTKEPERYLRRTAEGYLCPDCLGEYVDEHREEYTELFANENQTDFLLTWFCCGDCIPPFDEQWWIKHLTAALSEREISHPGSSTTLCEEYARDSGSDYEDFIIRQELDKSRKGAA